MTAILKTEYLCKITVFDDRELSERYAVERETVAGEAAATPLVLVGAGP
jgi:hypothetical protein